ncbi:MAG: methylmalonyl Co-A mutase-associated GTPase MeaB [Proteobacteria bacterium]|nr:methylmalonyl Co-A mutase-associated GTPase MeaB [Cystobacterineae bacterium]MCL2258368.1 methylmalonyl Co-A mutase-associated GTPase MeaB [Cystobacterineae bacterium]MCL2315269.1 methylmalonyl Co-A mutase-associated GTPase MeaB [Pseudomonadota bacterium]
MPEATHSSLLPEDRVLLEKLLAGERRALAKAITLVESSRADHRHRANELLKVLLPRTGNSIRLGISGVPGVGKSTFIETFGLWLVEGGVRLAVLAVDPSSSISGGSILGDKTRMELLATRPEAFIRPSPSAGSLGGVAEKTREAMLLAEAAGYNVVVVETVGVGQSETTVAEMVDMFILLQLPNAGDDLQAIKKGIVEVADLILINKADINPQAAAFACTQWKNALKMLRPTSPHWTPPILTVSAVKREGLEVFWREVLAFKSTLEASGEFAAKRKAQAIRWMWNLIDAGLRHRFHEHPLVRAELSKLSELVAEGRISPTVAAQQLLGFLQHS